MVGKRQGTDATINVPTWSLVPVVLVAGLPGCGKSTWCNAVAGQTGALLIDDFKAHARDLEFKSSCKLSRLAEAVAAGRRCIVADIDFTRTEARKEADFWFADTFPHIKPLWVFFANDPERCRANVLADNSRRAHARLRELDHRAADYHVPAGARVLPVWDRAEKM